jgi:chromosome partitioning protein
MILAIINNKGGTAKTTTAVNLAAGLAGAGKRTLLVDLDSQASASLSLGVSRADLTPAMDGAILDGAPLRSVIRPTGVDRLHLVTGAPALANADLALVNRAGREQRLAEILAPVRADFDYIVLDCPPSLSLLSVNALVAADAFIVPTPPEYLALEGLVGLLEAVDQIRDGIGATCRMMGILLTKVDRRRRVTGEVIELIRKHYKGRVFKTEIGVDVRLVEAPSFGQSIFEYDRRSSGAEAHRQLVGEVIRRSKA